MLPESDSFSVESAQVLLDVVVGVVIALPLTTLPAVLEKLFDDRRESRKERRAATVTLLTTLGALLFVTFYWLETRQFIANQLAFGRFLSPLLPRAQLQAVTLPRAAFVTGTLLMIIGAACVLTWATWERFRLYLLANAAFWLCDFGGTVLLKHSYLPMRQAFEQAVRQHPSDAAVVNVWYSRHIVSPFYYVYAIANAAIYLVLWYLDRRQNGRASWRIAFAGGLVVFTLLRHTVV